MESPELFAEYLESLLEDAIQEKSEICLPHSLCTAVMSTLEYLGEDLETIPPPLDTVSARLRHEFATRGGLDKP